MNKTQIEVTPSYIAGFFDGEGSALIITIRRQLETGIVYRFRPIIKISQKTRPVLEAIKNYIGYGHIDMRRAVHTYTINGLNGVLYFCKLISPFAFLKHDALSFVAIFAQYQKKRHGLNVPYSRGETLKLLNWRDALFSANSRTRANLHQKYPCAVILSETRFVDSKIWIRHRARNAIPILLERGKPYRFQKGVFYATNRNRVGT